MMQYCSQALCIKHSLSFSVMPETRQIAIAEGRHWNESALTEGREGHMSNECKYSSILYAIFNRPYKMYT